MPRSGLLLGEQTPKAKDPESAFGTAEAPNFDPVSTPRELDPPGSNKIGLTTHEIESFREKGYLIKRDLVSRELFSPILDLYWQQPPVLEAKMTRDNPESWIAPGRYWPEENRWSLAKNWMGDANWPSPEDARVGADIGERVGRLPHKLTKDIANDVWRWHGIGHDPYFVSVTSSHPNVLYMAELLMGGPIKKPRRNRGLYSIFPNSPEQGQSKLGPHMDQNMTEMTVVMYLEDVEPRSGGFTIYPGSAELLYPTSEQAFNWVATDRSREVMDSIKREVTPVEFTGKAGDVIFCHGLVVHSAGIHEGPNIRVAVIQDFNKVRQRGAMRWSVAGKNGGKRVNCDMDGLIKFTDDSIDDPSDGLREVTNQWIMDSNEYVVSREPPSNGVFSDWNVGQKPIEGNVFDEPPWWERYGLPMLPTGGVPRGGGGTPAVVLSDIAEYLGDGVWSVKDKSYNLNRSD